MQIWTALQEAMLLTTTPVRLSVKNRMSDPYQQNIRDDERFRITSQEVVDILSSTTPDSERQKLLIVLFQRERQRCIRSGQGWYLPLDHSTQTRECGLQVMARTLDMAPCATYVQEHDSSRKILEAVKTLFGIPTSRDGMASTLSRTASDCGQPAKAFDVPAKAQDIHRSPSQRCSRYFGTSALEPRRFSSVLPNSNGTSKPTGLRLSISDKSPLSQLVHGLVPLSPLETSSLQGPGSDNNAVIEIRDVIITSHTPIIHHGLEESGTDSLRLSEESTGAVTEAASVLATRGSRSTDSQDSFVPGLKPFLGKRAECLPVVREESQPKVETKRLSLHAHGTRLTNRLVYAFSASSPVLLLRNHHNLPATSNGDSPSANAPDFSDGAGHVSPISKEISEGQDNSTFFGNPQPIRDPQPSLLQPIGASALTQLDSAYFDSSGNNSRQDSRPTITNALPALSFIIPMFNHDCTIRTGTTPGQMEINLLRMIEAERQRCIVTGTVWNRRQIDGISWLISDIQNLVSGRSSNHLGVNDNVFLLRSCRSMIASWIAFSKGYCPPCPITPRHRSPLNDPWRISSKLLQSPTRHSLPRAGTLFPLHRYQNRHKRESDVQVPQHPGRPTRRVGLCIDNHIDQQSRYKLRPTCLCPQLVPEQ